MSRIATDADSVEFTAKYIAANPLPVQELYKMPIRNIGDQGARIVRAYELAAQGYTIDRCIAIEGWDPYEANKIYLDGNWKWVPKLGQPSVDVAPLLTQGNLKPYDPNFPPGVIPATLDFDMLGPSMFPDPTKRGPSGV